MSTGFTRRVLLYGELGEKFGREWRLDVGSAAEAIHAIAMQRDDFRPEIQALSDRGAQFQVIVGEETIGEGDLMHPIGRRDLKIVPVIVGAGDDSGTLQLVAGIVLLAVSAVLTYGTSLAYIGPALAVLNTGGYLAMAAGSIGLSLALGGVAQMISGTPRVTPSDLERQESPEQIPSHHFGGPTNTVGQGRPVPIVYGRMLVGGHRIAMEIQNA